MSDSSTEAINQSVKTLPPQIPSLVSTPIPTQGGDGVRVTDDIQQPLRQVQAVVINGHQPPPPQDVNGQRPSVSDVSVNTDQQPSSPSLNKDSNKKPNKNDDNDSEEKGRDAELDSNKKLNKVTVEPIVDVNTIFASYTEQLEILSQVVGNGQRTANESAEVEDANKSLKGALRAFKSQIEDLSGYIRVINSRRVTSKKYSKSQIKNIQYLTKTMKAVNDCVAEKTEKSQSSSSLSSVDANTSTTYELRDDFTRVEAAKVTALTTCANEIRSSHTSSLGWKILGGLMIAVGAIVAGLGGVLIAAAAGAAIPTFGLSIPTLGGVGGAAVVGGLGLMAGGKFFWERGNFRKKVEEFSQAIDNVKSKVDNKLRPSTSSTD
jgi:hypothetical protein